MSVLPLAPSAPPGPVSLPIAEAPAPAGNELGLFLRARRRNLTPERARIVVRGPRRLKGLRRGELAELAGVSAPYYARLEQGRARRPSPQVVAALGRALQLADDELAHLGRLCGQGGEAADDTRPDQATILAMNAALQQLHRSAATVVGPSGRALLSTELARMTCPIYAPGVNTMAWLFLDPAAGEMLPDLGTVQREAVARMRHALGGNKDVDGVQRVVARLMVRSADFRTLWDRHEVLKSWHGPIRHRHPAAGTFTLERVPLVVASAPSYTLHLLHPVDDAASRALELIARSRSQE